MRPPPTWQLPKGVTRRVWDYVQSPHIAQSYDANLAGSVLANIDVGFAQRHFTKPGRVIDLGCGTGRALAVLWQQGHQVVGVDLSEQMLTCARTKANGATLIKANIVDLGWLDDGSFDYAVCLFSTLGMIDGAANRNAFVKQVHRILRPGGCFVVHAHNRWFNFWNPQGRRWLLRDMVRSLLLRKPAGDHDAPPHLGLGGLRLHLFTCREILGLLRSAGFHISEVMPLGLGANGRLAAPWFFGRLRAYGYLIAAVR